MPPYYYAVRETDSYREVELHADPDCPDGPVRAAGSTVGGPVCPECDPEAEPDVCTVELSAGGECGRELPCQYHD
jgi:hypothetical protein